ncbi:hypothetical protein BGZ99_005513 [Dissophora globulifera]|uniref:Guanylate kinase n=1 Tax=Dissophora globulifera TaxID=979702 RepID=A0A9P6USC1_9FUNG|nr:hypothetical protein BGZ99_005513 [Dissophora globulifera]
MHGRPIVISGPSGSGKSTLINLLFKEYPETFGFSVSHTTRKPRPGEENGIAYHFVSNEAMKQLIAEKRFLEHAAFAGNLYGTSLAAVDHVINMHNKVCLLDIDLQGVRRVRESGLQARYIFVRPKSLTTLEERLRSRGTETEEAVQKRLERAKDEWAYGMDPKNFDHVVVNDDLDKAYTDLRDYIFAPQKSK